jgi:putative transposase
MHIARPLLLPEKSAFHYMWRCINGEFFMETEPMKAMFLNSFFKFMKRARGQVLLYSFCVMSNHFHMAAELLKDSTYMSWWARSGKSSFAQKLNKIRGRRGPVGQDRPKTVVVEDKESLMRLMFYHDWNPVAANMCKHPADYPFSSYRFYAFGEKNKWTSKITPPQWYEDLADTAEERQRLYRVLCEEYWVNKKKAAEAETKKDMKDTDEGYGIGSEKFVGNRTRLMRAIGRVQKQKRTSGNMKMSVSQLKRLAMRLVVPGGCAASPVANPGRSVRQPPSEAAG